MDALENILNCNNPFSQFKARLVKYHVFMCLGSLFCQHDWFVDAFLRQGTNILNHTSEAGQW